MNTANDCENIINQTLKDCNCAIVLRLYIEHNGLQIDATEELIKQFNITPKILVVENPAVQEGE